MDRLTIRNSDGSVSQPTSTTISAVFEKLAAYEDTGLEPADIEELLDAVPHWISVEERLPEDSGYTIVFCADGDRRHVTFAKYLKTPKRWELNGARSYWRVLCWMPLPEPPKEETDG